ncbi:MAG: signal recognition particle-docking protein FtsY [Azospirillum brasilense]|nr:MAG: signal recognition particle-docking protein FtsY [Azospirillum brasilense]
MNWFSRLSDGLKKTSTSLTEVFTKTKLDQDTLDALEEQLIMADMGAATAASIVAEIAEGRVDKDISAEEIRALLAAAVAKRLAPFATPLDVAAHAPCVVLVVGVNGNGKTTTIGKLAYQHQQAGRRVALVAADTFRAAAVAQLQRWAERGCCLFFSGAEGADPAAVAYAGLEAAMQQRADVVFIDTAGRLHTKKELMAELEKITKVMRKLVPDAPHHVLQVLDATTGQNALMQLEAFKQVAGVTGLVVTKLDGTAKAGVVLALAEKFRLPIHALGVGEGEGDLQPFRAEDFARALAGVAA